MNQLSKRDLILMRLYHMQKDGNSPTPVLHEVMQDLNIYRHKDDEKKMVDMLFPYIKINHLKEGINVRLNEEGLSYVKENLLL